jgi:hypothetical protein
VLVTSSIVTRTTGTINKLKSSAQAKPAQETGEKPLVQKANTPLELQLNWKANIMLIQAWLVFSSDAKT